MLLLVTDTSIRIDSETRDRLALLAEQRGVTVKALVREWAFLQLTPAEVAQRRSQVLTYIRENINPDFKGDTEDEAEGERLWAQVREVQYGPQQATA
jgi:hypothetical protein